MSVASISHDIQSIGFLTMIRESGYTYPIIMATHLASIAFFGGMVLMTNLRLLGWAMTSRPIADVVNGLRVWKRIGLAVILTCGVLLATSEMDKYYGNPYFQLKMTMLVLLLIHAIVFRRSVYQNPAALDRLPQPPPVAKRAAALSLILWTTVACLGRWIAYYEPPRDRGPAPAVAAISRPVPQTTWIAQGK
jgi:hypothetical protein